MFDLLLATLFYSISIIFFHRPENTFWIWSAVVLQLLTYQYRGSDSPLFVLGEHVLASTLFKYLIHRRKFYFAMLTKTAFAANLFLSGRMLTTAKVSERTGMVFWIAFVYMTLITYLVTLNKQIRVRLKQRVTRRFNSFATSVAFTSKALILSIVYNYVDRISLLDILQKFVPQSTAIVLQGFFWFKLLEIRKHKRILYPSAVGFSAFFSSISVFEVFENGQLPSLFIVIWSLLYF